MFQNRFVQFNLQPEENLLIETWTAETAQMLPFEWKNIHLDLVKAIEKYRPSKLLVHSEYLNFPITPDLQEWIANNIFPRAATAGLKKIAFVRPSDLFAQVSVEQLMEEDKVQHFTTRFFPNAREARKWIYEH